MFKACKTIIPVGLMLAGIALGTLSACAGPVITPSSFRGRCLTYSPGGITDGGYSCGDQPSICDEYVWIIQQDYSALPACIRACEETYARLYQSHIVGPCNPSIRYGRDNCKNYCRANYR